MFVCHFCYNEAVIERKKKWNVEQLKKAVKESRSIRQVLACLGLREAGGNYSQIRDHIRRQELDTSHFHGQAWNKGLKIPGRYLYETKNLLVRDSGYQSYKLKKRLLSEGLKLPRCEQCGWHKKSPDGRLPLELDHINGNNRDNRLENLRILCPNCHSLQPTHRGRNIKRRIGSVA